MFDAGYLFGQNPRNFKPTLYPRSIQSENANRRWAGPFGGFGGEVIVELTGGGGKTGPRV